MIPVVPYIKTLGTESFKEFILSEFDLDYLLKYFEGWKGSVNSDWSEFTSEQGTLKFFPVYYKIVNGKDVDVLPLPRTLNDFINDMDRYNIQLYWSEKMEIDFNARDFIEKDKINEYFYSVLTKMDKGHELLNNTIDEDR